MKHYVCDSKKIGENLRCARVDAVHPMTQLEFALEIGYDESAISRIERGVRYPTVEILFEYMNKFQVDANQLLGCEEHSEGTIRESVDARLSKLDMQTQAYLLEVFNKMIDFHMLK